MTPLPSIANGATEDAQLVAAVQAGDLHAYEPLVSRHLDGIHAFVALKLPVPHLVDEITHETFVFAFRSIAKFTPDTSFRGWLRAIAANKVRAEIERYYREERNRLAYTERRAIEDALQATAAPDSREVEALNDCLKDVPEKLRTLLNLKYHDESSSEEIASSLERSVAWVRTTLCRVRQQLRECVERKLKGQPS
ncbi:MAG: sigma-70 family RNA polymerase sigma factor [Verrucomicrobia bacterium]|nr:sigma-70 family RNA polymerase sigma factor [Verrucomicrobiota bacterium]